MTEQQKVAGWKVWINHYEEGGLTQQKVYLVAIPDELVMIDAICEILKLKEGMLARRDPVSVDTLDLYGVKQGVIYHLADMAPP